MPHKTKLVGILNITPDSFSDGGAYMQADAALQRLAALIDAGADIIDIGAESTRPGATPLTAEAEWRRLQPMLEGLRAFKTNKVQFSVDTRHAATAKAALAYGVDWINDVSGFADARMVAAVRASACKLVVMHALGIPADPRQTLPEAADVVGELLAFAHARLAELVASGIHRSRLIFDPGIGFGKTPAQSLAILRGIRQFEALGVPVLVGHSRKSFLAGLTKAPPAARDDATLVISQFLAQEGVEYLRVHNVARHRELLNILEALAHG